ncbi:MAG: methyltransferase domain-containing protein [Alphaproteobacteria bacterium]|nr:methyltransferase domain-containing protein [Alphaproteobacteria bacterium]MBF0129453.1 methyltransferase domain-containing protein [Alphaproteobacteria bacterium]
MNAHRIKQAYRRYAAVYDKLFGRVFDPGRRQAMGIINAAPNRRVLEVGIGTGLSLPFYRQDIRVTGIDFSNEMLAKARDRVARHGLSQIEDLIEMDAQFMTFPDNSFDAVVAMYVVSVVPDPERLLAEIRRVCVAGGDIIVVNHFASRNVLLRFVERALSPLSSLIGFRTDLELEDFLRAAAVETVAQTRVNAMGFWHLIRFRNTPAPPWPARELPDLSLELEVQGDPAGP